MKMKNSIPFHFVEQTESHGDNIQIRPFIENQNQFRNTKLKNDFRESKSNPCS